MKEPALVILAAGMGSRYGGLKQIDPVDSFGNKIIDFSIYDAIKAGFKKVVFIIKKDRLSDFKTCIGDTVEKYIDVDYVFQELTAHLHGHEVPEGREKPWGTGHALLCCKDALDSGFAVINADDFYGREAYEKIYSFLTSEKDGNKSGSKHSFAMVGYALKNTLTENGSVSRGICRVNENNELVDIVERTKIIRTKEGAAYTEDGENYIPISPEAIASMNLWGYSADFFHEASLYFEDFLEKEVPANPLKAEFYIPTIVHRMINEQKASVTVLKTDEKWFGVTYREDKPFVEDSIRKLREKGLYPEKLWD